jgi:hypothetical protein
MAQTADNPEAQAGIKRAVVDYIKQNLADERSDFNQGTTTVLKSRQLQNFINKSMPALRQIFSPEEIKSIRNVALDLAQSEQSVSGTKLPGQSNTAQDESAKSAHGGHSSSMLSKMIGAELIGELAHGAAEVFLPGSGMAAHAIGSGTAISSVLLTEMRNAGIKKVDDLVTQAMLHPDLARVLMQKVTNKAAPSFMPRIASRLRALAVQAAITPTQPEPPKQPAWRGQLATPWNAPPVSAMIH